jgi:hypothetical protein
MVILPCFSSPVHNNMPLSSPIQNHHFEEVLSKIMDRMHQTLIKSMNSAVAKNESSSYTWSFLPYAWRRIRSKESLQRDIRMRQNRNILVIAPIRHLLFQT